MLCYFLLYSKVNQLYADQYKKTTQSKNGQKTYIDISPEKTYTWPKGM